MLHLLQPRNMWKAVLSNFTVSLLSEKEIALHDLVRHPSVSVRSFLINTLASPVHGVVSQRMVHQLCDLYEHARYDPNEFGDEEYQMYSKLLLKLMDA